jgi:sterol desaturase/sphingolipid hydroxylase (fatty acid hydroxylase superfamily)
LIAYAVPVFLGLLALEWWLSRRRPLAGARGYEWRDTATSLSLGVANVAVAALTKGGFLLVALAVFEHRLFDVPNAWWAFGLLFLGEDLCYYAFHRASHEVRFFWAAHVNHHSSRHYNLSTALRQSWTTPLTGPVFWLPLAWLGFHPALILAQQGVSLVYQFWLHSERIGRLGPLEWVLNTPSHHRVHHGRNVEYLDRNYGGILIVWDRLFGSFEPERAPVDYGLTRNLDSFDPLVVGFHEWIALARDFARARGLRERLLRVFAPPGWSPDGSTRTARQLQAGLAAAAVVSGAAPRQATGASGASARQATGVPGAAAR